MPTLYTTRARAALSAPVGSRPARAGGRMGLEVGALGLTACGSSHGRAGKPATVATPAEEPIRLAPGYDCRDAAECGGKCQDRLAGACRRWGELVQPTKPYLALGAFENACK